MLTVNEKIGLDLNEIRESLKGARRNISDIKFKNEKKQLIALDAIYLIDKSLVELGKISKELLNKKAGE